MSRTGARRKVRASGNSTNRGGGRWLGSASRDDAIEQIESYWKSKLLTRRFGLNAN